MTIDTSVLKNMAREQEKLTARVAYLRQEVKTLEAMLQTERENHDETSKAVEGSQFVVAELRGELQRALDEGRRTQAQAFENSELAKRLALTLRHVLSAPMWGTSKAWDYGTAILRQEGVDKP